ncbi:antibiotic biosynthesis monooxygenase family protein [Paractinoplanes toevensis]|uniref:ABM domain-containing protein n=1 Tax=Paractinoplanes toevensis TaxID=571911 RepID=A0A919TAV6_9ACTN|nr:antibiotic biosynthesis monooxygenase [Actinoplanes toevensis]GIM92619.1 hypothetical protein Ato02nite_044120 [Actinoplanes toevensis]
MADLSPDNDYFTTISVFRAKPQNQQELYALLREGEEELAGFPGLVSATLHLGEDGERVIGYSQWLDEKDFQAMRGRADRKEHFQQVRGLVESVDLIACRVAYTNDKN